MLYDIEKILLMIRDMQEMVNPGDALSSTISDAKQSSIELNVDELDLIAAAGDNSLSSRKDNDDL